MRVVRICLLLCVLCAPLSLTYEACSEDVDNKYFENYKEKVPERSTIEGDANESGRVTTSADAPKNVLGQNGGETDEEREEPTVRTSSTSDNPTVDYINELAFSGVPEEQIKTTLKSPTFKRLAATGMVEPGFKEAFVDTVNTNSEMVALAMQGQSLTYEQLAYDPKAQALMIENTVNCLKRLQEGKGGEKAELGIEAFLRCQGNSTEIPENAESFKTLDGNEKDRWKANDILEAAENAAESDISECAGEDHLICYSDLLFNEASDEIREYHEHFLELAGDIEYSYEHEEESKTVRTSTARIVQPKKTQEDFYKDIVKARYKDLIDLLKGQCEWDDSLSGNLGGQRPDIFQGDKEEYWTNEAEPEVKARMAIHLQPMDAMTGNTLYNLYVYRHRRSDKPDLPCDALDAEGEFDPERVVSSSPYAKEILTYWQYAEYVAVDQTLGMYLQAIEQIEAQAPPKLIPDGRDLVIKASGHNDEKGLTAKYDENLVRFETWQAELIQFVGRHIATQSEFLRTGIENAKNPGAGQATGDGQ